MKKTDNLLMLFAKAPIPGFSKTRLIPALGKVGAADLQRQLILNTLGAITNPGEWDIQLWCAPEITDPFFQYCQSQFPITLKRQHDGDLGHKMASAFQLELDSYSQVVIIGTDCPAIEVATIRQAFAALEKGLPVVVCPAEDGGYVLLGMNQFSPNVFSDIAWGSRHVLHDTRMRLADLQWQWQELPTLWDVDNPEDLQRYYQCIASKTFGEVV